MTVPRTPTPWTDPPAQQMLPKVTSCYPNSATPQNKGLTDASGHEVTAYPHLCQLTPLQTQALDLRLRGLPIGKIAQKLGVTRQTIYRWCHHHPAFIAELNQRQVDMLSQSTLAYRRLLRKSFGVLKKALVGEGPDSLRVALAFANGTTARKLFAQEVGPTDEVSAVNQMALSEQRTWDFKDGYMGSDVHGDYVYRLAQVDFTPKPPGEDAADPLPIEAGINNF